MYNRILTIIAAVAITFAGCNKMEETRNDGFMPPFKGPVLSIRSFADFNQLHSEIELINELTYDELLDYEATLHFSSFGKLADQAMMPILQQVEQAMEEDEDSSITSTELEQLVSASSQYIHLVSDESGEVSCETKYFRSHYRYIMNSDRMFKVDTFYFKVFEGGHVSCGATYFNQLLSMSESTFSTLQSDSIYNVFKYDDGGKGYYGWYVERKSTCGKIRVLSALDYHEDKRIVFLSGVMIVNGGLWVRTWGHHKWAGIWWIAQRTYTNALTGKLYVNGTIKTGSDFGSNGGFKRERKLISTSDVTYYGNPLIYIYGASGSAYITGCTVDMSLP